MSNTHKEKENNYNNEFRLLFLWKKPQRAINLLVNASFLLNFIFFKKNPHLFFNYSKKKKTVCCSNLSLIHASYWILFLTARDIHNMCVISLLRISWKCFILEIHLSSIVINWTVWEVQQQAALIYSNNLVDTYYYAIRVCQHFGLFFLSSFFSKMLGCKIGCLSSVLSVWMDFWVSSSWYLEWNRVNILNLK